MTFTAEPPAPPYSRRGPRPGEHSTKKFKPFSPRVHDFVFRWPGEDARINLLDGSVRSTKTWSTIAKFPYFCGYPVSGRKILTGVTKQTVYQNVLMDLFDLAGPGNYSYNRVTGEMSFIGHEWLVIGAHDEGSEKVIRGMTVGLAVCDELVKMPKSFFMMLLSRMSPEGARLYATTNPENPTHWVKTDLIDNHNYSHGVGRDLFHLTLTMDDNPALSEDYRQFVRRSYTGVWYDRFVRGLWVMASGAVYRDVLNDGVYYDDSDRPVGLETRGGHREHWIVIDYGTVNPMVFLDLYDDGQRVWYDREYYWDSRRQGRQKTDAQYADDLVKFIGKERDARDWPGIILDPSAASFRAELLSRGLYCIDANNEVDDGIRRVSTMLERRLIRIHRRCRETIREMTSYCWDLHPLEKGKDVPVKKHDHTCDCIRYHTMTRIGDWRIAAAA
jgi:PBSX family phage terminase large subunit